jgi:hypothetical protein
LAMVCSRVHAKLDDIKFAILSGIPVFGNPQTYFV